MTWALKVLSTVVLSPQLTPADSSSLSDYSSEPALYFWSLGPISCTVASHPWDQTAARAQPGLPHLGLNCLQLYTPAASKHIFLIRQETMFCLGFFLFFFNFFSGGVMISCHGTTARHVTNCISEQGSFLSDGQYSIPTFSLTWNPRAAGLCFPPPPPTILDSWPVSLPPSSSLADKIESNPLSRSRELPVFFSRLWKKFTGFHVPPLHLSCFIIHFKSLGDTDKRRSSKTPSKNRKPPVPMRRWRGVQC